MNFFLIFSSVLSFAGPFEPGERPGPIPRRCDQGALNACVNDHRAKIGQANSAIQIINEKIAIITRDLAPVSQRESSLVAEEKSALAGARLAKAEIDDISKPEVESSPLFSSDLTPENIFLLEKNVSLGAEPHPEARKQRLQTIVVLSGNRVKELAPALRKLAMEINHLRSETEALLRERSHLETASAAHGRMCDFGCKEQICPEL